MLFPTLDYLLFLPLSVLLYWLVPRQARLAVLGLSSLVFYASWRLAYVPLLLAVIAIAWVGGGLLHSLRARQRPMLGAQTAIVVLLLIPLIVFKYWNWLAGDVEQALLGVGVALNLPPVELPLPIGISFFTFQALAYVIDCGRHGDAEANPGRFAVFIGFFPQLIAGPIVRRHELLPQLADLPLLARGQVGAGLFRIGRGMAKKVLFADTLRVGIVDPLFADPSKFTGVELAIGLYAYTLQIYYDFAGYTDIAIGSARLFGLELPENFKRPYKAITITDFWRRWHITLGLWVRHYIYFPLGGAQGAAGRVYFNLLATFLILGVWHGASWNFVVYGLLHGTAMVVQRYFRKKHGRDPAEAPPGWWAWTWRFLLTFHFIVLARILFRAKDFTTSWEYTQGLWDTTLLMPRFAPLALGTLVLGYVIHFSPDSWQDRAELLFKRSGPILWTIALAEIAALCALLGSGQQLEFIYYQF